MGHPSLARYRPCRDGTTDTLSVGPWREDDGGMDRRLRVLAAVVIALTFCAAVGILVLHPANRGQGVGAETTDWLRLAISPLVNVPLAGLLVTRRSRHPIGWLLLAAAVLQALSGFGEEYGAAAI